MMTMSTIQQVISLQTKNTEELKLLWSNVFGTQPPHYSKAYLIRRLATRIQELAYGGLADTVQKQLATMMNDMKKGKPLANHFVKDKPRIGTQFIREYQGIAHHVTVVDQGYTYQGQLYKSLSVIARKITGTQWSGPKFFGVKK